MNRLLFVLVELGTAVQVIDLFCTAGIFESFVESEAMAPHEKSKVDKGAHVLEEKNSQSATFCPGYAVGGGVCMEDNIIGSVAARHASRSA